MKFSDPMTETPEGRLLAITRGLLKAVEKNTNCMHKEGESCKNCYSKKGYKSDRGQGKKPKLPSPKGDKNKLKSADKSVEKNPALMALGGAAATGAGEGFGAGVADAIDRRLPGGKSDDKSDDKSDKKKSDATSEFLRERGIIAKYEQEHSVDNQVPQFMEISGQTEIRAAGYTTNQRLPHMGEGNALKPISEVAKMPKVAQTGYDAKGSSLHMHLNDGGGFADNRAPIEESLAELKIMKAGGRLGIVEEIAELVEEVYTRL
jgi:hypothetical protein